MVSRVISQRELLDSGASRNDGIWEAAVVKSILRGCELKNSQPLSINHISTIAVLASFREPANLKTGPVPEEAQTWRLLALI